MYAEQAFPHQENANLFFFRRQNSHLKRGTHTGQSPSRLVARLVRSAAAKPRQRQDKTLVELSGIEPLTPCLQSRCSPS